MLDTFCELIIDELKHFSASRQSISPSSLLEALSNKADVLKALASQEHIGELRRGYIKILDQLNGYFTSDQRESADQLVAVIKRAESLSELYRIHEGIIGLVCQCVSDSEAKKKSLACLLIEVGAKLGELEGQSLSLIESTAQVHRANGRFTSLIETEIAELESSAESSKDVLEVREIVRTKLERIKSALETKKAEDRARNQSFESTIQNLQNNLKEMQHKIDRDRTRRKRLEHEALIDPLTGISNRRVMERRINKGIRRHERDKTVFSLVFVDIDDFKRVNDTYGHRVGDKCLQSLVGRMRQVLRESDHIARYGGDEFVIFLANTGKKAAQVVANKLSSAISKTCFLYRNTEIQLSVSIGITQIESGDTSPEEIIARADTALYEAKNLGKDCIIVT